MTLVSLQSNLETSFLNCNCWKKSLKYIDKVGLSICFSKETLIENSQINVRIEMYSGLSMVNDETQSIRKFVSNIYLFPKVSSRGVIQFTRHVTITRKCLKSIAERIEHGANIDDQDYLSGNVPFHFPVSFGHIGILKLLIYWRNHLV